MSRDITMSYFHKQLALLLEDDSFDWPVLLGVVRKKHGPKSNLHYHCLVLTKEYSKEELADRGMLSGKHAMGEDEIGIEVKRYWAKNAVPKNQKTIGDILRDVPDLDEFLLTKAAELRHYDYFMKDAHAQAIWEYGYNMAFDYASMDILVGLVTSLENFSDKLTEFVHAFEVIYDPLNMRSSFMDGFKTGMKVVLESDDYSELKDKVSNYLSNLAQVERAEQEAERAGEEWKGEDWDSNQATDYEDPDEDDFDDVA